MKVIIPTCDKYLWVIPTFLHFYEKNWPDSPYQLECITETIKAEGMPTFCAGKLPWADRMIKYLETYDEESFLLIMDDCFIIQPVVTSAVQKAAKLCTGDIGCVRLNHHSSYNRYLFNSGIVGFIEYPNNKPYAVSVIACIWQKEYFLAFLRKGENAWQTESEGSRRVSTSKKRILRSDIVAINHFNGGLIKKGKVNEAVNNWSKENW